jgi:hypothetical protein
MARFVTIFFERQNLRLESELGYKNFQFFALLLAITMNKKNSRRRQDHLSLNRERIPDENALMGIPCTLAFVHCLRSRHGGLSAEFLRIDESA